MYNKKRQIVANIFIRIGFDVVIVFHSHKTVYILFIYGMYFLLSIRVFIAIVLKHRHLYDLPVLLYWSLAK